MAIIELKIYVLGVALWRHLETVEDGRKERGSGATSNPFTASAGQTISSYKAGNSMTKISYKDPSLSVYFGSRKLQQNFGCAQRLYRLKSAPSQT